MTLTLSSLCTRSSLARAKRASRTSSRKLVPCCCSVRWSDRAPFDADGPGTSDLDLTLVGDEAIKLFKLTGFFVPGMHSRPVSDEDPDIAPDLVPLRQKLMAMVGRPVNIQASRDIVMHLRGDVLGQPYLVLLEKKAA